MQRTPRNRKVWYSDSPTEGNSIARCRAAKIVRLANGGNATSGHHLAHGPDALGQSQSRDVATNREINTVEGPCWGRRWKDNLGKHGKHGKHLVGYRIEQQDPARIARWASQSQFADNQGAGYAHGRYRNTKFP